MFKRLVTVLIFFALGFVPQFGYAQTVRISYSGTSGQNLTFWVAYEAGLFKKYGLNTELIFIAGGSTNIQGLLANEIGFAHVGGSSPIQAILQGAEIVILATSYGLMPYGLVTGKTIHCPGDFNGQSKNRSRRIRRSVGNDACAAGTFCRHIARTQYAG